MPAQNKHVPNHFVVIIPGVMGSRLRDRNTGKTVWVDFSSIPFNPLQWGSWVEHLLSTVAYPNPDLEPAGILNEVVFVPPWVKQEQYSRLLTALRNMGYNIDPQDGGGGTSSGTGSGSDGPNAYTFGYDWRQDNRISARQLGEAIQQWRAQNPPDTKAWIIAHSMGGLVARWYIEKEGGKDYVGRLFLMASPRDGAPQAMRMLIEGMDTLFRRVFNIFNIGESTRQLVRTFPSIYQLLPYEDPFLRGVNNEVVDPFSNLSWLNDERQRQLLLDGREFNQDLGTTLSVDTLCFFGRKKPTNTYGVVRFTAGGSWNSVEWNATEAGDGTVPERSALHPNASEKLPFAADHGNIYVNPSVLEFLEWEMYGRYQAGERAALATQNLTIIFEPDKDVYSPGESINLVAMIHRNREGSPPVSDAQVQVQLVWVQALPGAGTYHGTPAGQTAQVPLWESEDTRGRYDGTLQAPTGEGYYRLRATVQVTGEPPALLEELISVEAMPTADTADTEG